MKNLDLDVDSPDKVGGVLRRAAEAYYESAGELQGAWGDRNAGKIWEKIAHILDRAADSIDRNF